MLLAIGFTSNSQSLGYQDLAILFSQNDTNGSARFTAMSGAFGALGGDVSAINVNPAGLGIFTNSTFSATLNSRNTDNTTNYYENSIATQNQFFNLSHAGAVLVFDSAYSTDWAKFAIGFNYRITKDFNNTFLTQGNSGVATFREYPLDNNNPALDYFVAEQQTFSNTYRGEISEFNIGFSSVYQNKLYVGLGLNFYNLDFVQQSILTEFNNDIDGNELDVNLFQENYSVGTAFSANAGFIYKAHPNFRFGLAYQTPTWYSEILQDTNFNQDNDIDIGETTFYQGNETYTESNSWQYISYGLKTPSKLTASAAFIFGKSGLLSFDYINKNYKNLRLSNAFFTEENQFFQNQLRNTHNFNVGAEWRLDKFSIRAGYKFEQTPNNSATLDNQSVLNFNDVEGYSLGAGYNFGNFKLDFSYSDNNNSGLYNFYKGFTVNASSFQIDNRTFTATFTLNL